MANLYIARSGTLLPVPETRIGDLTMYIPSSGLRMSTTRSLTSLHLSKSLTFLHLDVSGVCIFGSAGKKRDGGTIRTLGDGGTTVVLGMSAGYRAVMSVAQSTANRYHAPSNDRLHFLHKNSHL
ncbi:hypothetical protein M9H77_13018 [Catharanthus roseus]|uniref:Uncharacterized protein n=1 Tax=Catharanthus roseus TaxID=4058 RepID=A0ACC0BJ92_CATRO|nr:hypothetical protein M9H77_13018 [Catharanthus roseus]